MATLNYYLYNPKAKDKSLVIMRFRYNNTLFVFSTRQKVDPQLWNPKNKRARAGKRDDLIELNKLLGKLENEAYTIYRERINESIPLTNKVLKDHFLRFLQIDKTDPVLNHPLEH